MLSSTIIASCATPQYYSNPNAIEHQDDHVNEEEQENSEKEAIEKQKNEEEAILEERLQAEKEEREENKRKAVELQVKTERDAELTKQARIADKNNDLKKLLALCKDEQHIPACKTLSDKCYTKNSEACGYAMETLKVVTDDSEQRKKVYTRYAELKCKFSEKTMRRYTCMDDFFNNGCGASRSEIVSKLGEPDQELVCENYATALNYGAYWFTLKYGKAILVQVHPNFWGPCHFVSHEQYNLNSGINLCSDERWRLGHGSEL